MDTLEKIELIREKCGVSYEDANTALQAANGEVLDAIIWLERQGKSKTARAEYTTKGESEQSSVSSEQLVAQARYEESSRKGGFKEDAKGLFRSLKRIFDRLGNYRFVAHSRDESTVVNVPLIVPILGLFLWGATIWLLLIGLFLGARYRIEGPSDVTDNINDAMDKAADLTDRIKKDVTDNASE